MVFSGRTSSSNQCSWLGYLDIWTIKLIWPFFKREKEPVWRVRKSEQKLWFVERGPKACGLGLLWKHSVEHESIIATTCNANSLGLSTSLWNGMVINKNIRQAYFSQAEPELAARKESWKSWKVESLNCLDRYTGWREEECVGGGGRWREAVSTKKKKFYPKGWETGTGAKSWRLMWY